MTSRLVLCNRIKSGANIEFTVIMLNYATAPYAVWTVLKDHQRRWQVYSNDRPWDNYRSVRRVGCHA